MGFRIIKKTLFMVALLLLFVTAAVAKPTVSELLSDLTKIQESDVIQSARLINELEVRLSEFESDDQKANFYIKKAYHYLVKNHTGEARKALKDVFDLNKVSVSNQVYTFNYLAQLELSLRNYTDAFDYTFKASELMHLLNDNSAKFNFYHGTAYIFLESETLDAALENAKKALEIASKTDNAGDICYAKSLIEKIELKKIPSESRLANIKNVIELCSEASISMLVSDNYNSLGYIYLLDENLSLAKKAFSQAKDTLKITPYLPIELNLLSNMAELSIKDRDFDQAEQFAKEIILKSNADEFAYDLSKAFKTLSITSYNKGDIEAAYKYLNQFIELNNTIQKDLADKNLAYQKVKFFNHEQQAQVKILDQENQLLKLYSEVQKQSKRVYQLFSIASILFVALVFLLFIRMKRQKERYQELSRKDGLTGVLSRRYVLNIAKEMHSKSMKSGLKYSLVVFDLDYFKSINDKYGHAIGDWVLKQVTEKVSNEIREGDAFGRLGGEEFVLVLPNTESGNAKKLAERCLEAIKTIRHEVFQDSFIVTASFGVATYTKFKDLEVLIQNADDAMYKAKQMGRNQVFSFAQ